MNEAPTTKFFPESDLYRDPRQAFDAAIGRLTIGEELTAYLRQVLTSDNPKDDSHQESFKLILEALLKDGRKEEAGLLFNLHRIFTEFSGYGANDAPSSDVSACFGQDFEIPAQGLILVDFFVTRNLPKIIHACEEREVDLGRIRVCVPQAIVAAQLMRMSAEKRAEFEEACSKLREDQFIIEDVNHNADIKPEGDVAIWFSPRTMPVAPSLHGVNEEDTIRNYCAWFREKVAHVVSGGRIYANLAYSEVWQPFGVEATEERRHLTKLTGMSRNVAASITRLLVDELNFRPLGKAEFSPADVDPSIDHAKLATELHMVKEP